MASKGRRGPTRRRRSVPSRSATWPGAPLVPACRFAARCHARAGWAGPGAPAGAAAGPAAATAMAATGPSGCRTSAELGDASPHGASLLGLAMCRCRSRCACSEEPRPVQAAGGAWEQRCWHHRAGGGGGVLCCTPAEPPINLQLVHACACDRLQTYVRPQRDMRHAARDHEARPGAVRLVLSVPRSPPHSALPQLALLPPALAPWSTEA